MESVRTLYIYIDILVIWNI